MYVEFDDYDDHDDYEEEDAYDNDDDHNDNEDGVEGYVRWKLVSYAQSTGTFTQRRLMMTRMILMMMTQSSRWSWTGGQKWTDLAGSATG